MGNSFSTSRQAPSKSALESLPPNFREAKCPVTHHSDDGVNPHNNVPVLSQSPAHNQLNTLSVERAVSSIPRPNSSVDTYSPVDAGNDCRWEYPSPQQFYNALLRKGRIFPDEHMEPMVLLHNRLNEEAWQEILKWESRNQRQLDTTDAAPPKLAHFQGLHGKLSHKARLYQLARRFFPAYFCYEPPFDRHDWVVQRPSTNKKVRYVIDYYSLRESPHEEPVFHLDVRPALDSLGNVTLRLIAALEHLLSKVNPFITIHLGILLLIACLALLGHV